MAPASPLAARSKGLGITSAAVQTGQPTVVKFSWKYLDKSPEYFAVGIIETSSNTFTLLFVQVETRGHGTSGSGTFTVSIEILKNNPGKYILVLVDKVDYTDYLAQSKAFQVKKSDF